MRRRRLLGGMSATALAAALTVASGVSGCSILPSQPYLQRRDWPLVVRRSESGSAQPPRHPYPRTLLVRTVQAGPGLETRGLQTLQPDGSLTTAFYEQWAVPPAEGIDDDLRRWIADSGLYAAVLDPGSRMTADLSLEAELLTLHADLGSGTARVALSLLLLDQRTNPARIRLQRTEAAEVKLEGTDPPALVRAQLTAVTAVLRQAEADLASARRA
jgi:cholesterol transport system auxiliary component